MPSVENETPFRSKTPPGTYKVVGAIYAILGTPALVGLFTGTVRRGGNPYLALSLLCIPLGILFLLFGFGRFRLTTSSQTAVMVGIAGLINVLFMAGSSLIVRSGNPGFETAYQFSGVAASFLALVALVLLLHSALINRR